MKKILLPILLLITSCSNYIKPPCVSIKEAKTNGKYFVSYTVISTPDSLFRINECWVEEIRPKDRPPYYVFSLTLKDDLSYLNSNNYGENWGVNVKLNKCTMFGETCSGAPPKSKCVFHCITREHNTPDTFSLKVAAGVRSDTVLGTLTFIKDK